MKSKFEYIIRIDGEEVWRGLNPKDKFWEFKKRYPDKEVGIAWHSDDDILVC